MTTYFFRNPKHTDPSRHTVHRVRRGRNSETGTHIAFPVLGGRAWLAYFLKRLAICAVGSALVFHVALVIFFLGSGIVLSWLNPPVTSLMAERLFTDHYSPCPVAFVPFARLPEYVPVMYLKLEDKHFYLHHGIDPAAIGYAYVQNKRWGRVIMGGSTITQQMARSIFLSPDKNYLRKYIEAVAAVSLDAVMAKKRIFELYLNYIEWGKGVYGLGSAAEYYFKKPADKLDYDQYSRLAAIIINPIDYDVNNFYSQPAMVARYLTLTEALPEDEETTAPFRSTSAASPESGKAETADPPTDILP